MLKKLNKKTNEEGLRQIRANFEQMGKFQKLAGEGKDKFIGGFKIMDLIGKGKFSSIFMIREERQIHHSPLIDFYLYF